PTSAVGCAAAITPATASGRPDAVRGPTDPQRRLVAYGHSWVAGEAASRPERRLTPLAAARLGMTPVSVGVGGSSTTDTAGLVRREGAARADAYLILAGLNDAR